MKDSILEKNALWRVHAAGYYEIFCEPFVYWRGRPLFEILYLRFESKNLSFFARPDVRTTGHRWNKFYGLEYRALA